MASAMVCVSLHHPATSGGGSLGLGQFMREVGFCKEAKFRETLKRWNRKEWESEVQRRQMRLWSARSPLEQTKQIVEVARKGAPLLLEGEKADGSSTWKALPDIWRTAAIKYGERLAVLDPHHDPPTQLTFKQLEQSILDFAEALRAAGAEPDQTVALFADNSHRWLIADQGIMAAGAVNAVRGSRSSVEELFYIYSHSDSVALVIDNVELFKKLAPRLQDGAKVKFVVLLWGSKSSLDSTNGALLKDTPIHSFDEFIKMGSESSKSNTGKEYSIIQPDDVATLVYTSGTTGKPKGVMLTHNNLLHQVVHLWSVIQPTPGQRFLTLLPPWHMYERSCEYFYLARGVHHVYTNVTSLKEDLVLYPPDYFVAVPLVLELLYNGVQKQLAAAKGARKTLAMALISISTKYMDAKRVAEGKDLSSARTRRMIFMAFGQWIAASLVATVLLPLHLLAKVLVYKKIRGVLTIRKALISGGGSLPPHVDKFFEVIGITLLNGYGLTETSPVLAGRLPENNVLGSVGKPVPLTEVKVVDIETGEMLARGVKGLIKTRGPQIMKGYYKNEEATRNTIDKDGWLDTGDLGWVAPEMGIGSARMCGGVLVLDGRAKDTIVLSTGENVEPTEIEEAMSQSTLIQQIVVLGQDQRRLAALIVADKKDLQAAAHERLKSKGSSAEPTEADMRACIREELKTYGANCSHPIVTFAVLYEPFTIENGMLTPTMKVRRDVVTQVYKQQIDPLFK